MPWSGAGVFTRTDGTRTGATVWAQAKAALIKILSTAHDTHDQDLATGINACLAKNGENAATGNLPMGGYKLTGLGAGSARTDSASLVNIQDGGVLWGGTAGGSAGAFTISLTPAITAYAAGQRFAFIANHTPSGTATLAVNGISGAKDIVRYDGATAHVASDITSGDVVEVIYDGTAFRHLRAYSPGTFVRGVLLAYTTAESILTAGATPVSVSLAGHALHGFPVARAGLVTRLRCVVIGSLPSPATTGTFKLYKNGIDTTVSCSASVTDDSTLVAGAQTCAVAISPGDVLSITGTGSGFAEALYGSVSILMI